MVPVKQGKSRQSTGALVERWAMDSGGLGVVVVQAGGTKAQTKCV